MKLEPNNKSLSFADFLEAAFRDKADTKPFPYTLEVCKCRYCSYCQSGKCALKRCCCMSERVKAKSCTFAELLRDCFANFKDNVFQYRLRIACERASELQSCFLDAGHKGRFYEGVTLLRKKDPKFIAQIYLLSASELLWIRAKQVMCSPGFIDYGCLDLKLTEPNGYLYFCTAMDIQYGGSHIDLYELTLDEIIDFDAFRVICNSVAICLYGMDAVTKIVQYSEYYRTFSGVLQIRTIRAEYLVAMKLVSGRQYKKDLSDIAGIVYEQQMAGKPLSYEMIDKAVCNLYGNWDNVEKYARDLLDKILACDDLQALFIELSEDEKAAKEALSDMIKKYPSVVKQDNVNDVIAATLKKKRQREQRQVYGGKFVLAAILRIIELPIYL